MVDDRKKRLESIVDAVLRPTGANGVFGRTARFEQVIDGLTAFVTRHRESDTEILNFPPVMSRTQLEKSGYLDSFPHLLGCVSTLRGRESEIRSLLERRSPSQDWADALAATDLVLTPAACYPVYPLVANRGPVPAKGVTVDVASYCFRREATHEVGRLQSFRMREFVFIGDPDRAIDFRSRWMSQAERFAKALALPYRIDPASDPFFGKAGVLMARSQVEQSLKFELLIPVHSEDQPTACMSFNCHRDHFGSTWDLKLAGGAAAHTACVAFGLDRLTLALFVTHGLDFQTWPSVVRQSLSV